MTYMLYHNNIGRNLTTLTWLTLNTIFVMFSWRFQYSINIHDLSKLFHWIGSQGTLLCVRNALSPYKWYVAGWQTCIQWPVCRVLAGFTQVGRTQWQGDNTKQSQAKHKWASNSANEIRAKWLELKFKLIIIDLTLRVKHALKSGWLRAFLRVHFGWGHL